MSKLVLFVAAVTFVLVFGLEWGDPGQTPSYGRLTDQLYAQRDEGPLIVFFGKEDCGNCRHMRESVDGLLAEYPLATVGFFDIEDDDNQEPLQLLLAHYAPGGIRELYPVIFVGETMIVGEGLIQELELRIAVEDCLARGCPSPLDYVDAVAADDQ